MKKIRPGRDNHGFDMSPLIKISPSPYYRIASPPAKSPRPTIFTGKNPPGPAAARAGWIFTGKLSAGKTFLRGDPTMGHKHTHAQIRAVKSRCSRRAGQREEEKKRKENQHVEVTRGWLTRHDDGYRTSPDGCGVLHYARVISGIRLERADDTQHAFKRTHSRLGLGGFDFQSVWTLPSAQSHNRYDVFVQFWQRP